MNPPHHHTDDQDQEQERRLDIDVDAALRDPYAVLGISRQSDSAAIKRAYFAKVREHPPERDPVAFQRIRAAYDALRTPEAKAATDLFLIHSPLPYTPYKRKLKLDLDFHLEDRWLLAREGTDLLREDWSADFRDLEL